MQLKPTFYKLAMRKIFSVKERKLFFFSLTEKIFLIAIHNKALSDFAYAFSYTWWQSRIESCYVCGGFQLNFLAKKLSAGGRGKVD